MNRFKQYVMIALVAGTLLISQIACDEVDETREIVGDIGCYDTTARDACGGDATCRIKACQFPD